MISRCRSQAESVGFDKRKLAAQLIAIDANMPTRLLVFFSFVAQRYLFLLDTSAYQVRNPVASVPSKRNQALLSCFYRVTDLIRGVSVGPITCHQVGLLVSFLQHKQNFFKCIAMVDYYENRLVFGLVCFLSDTVVATYPVIKSHVSQYLDCYETWRHQRFSTGVEPVELALKAAAQLVVGACANCSDSVPVSGVSGQF